MQGRQDDLDRWALLDRVAVDRNAATVVDDPHATIGEQGYATDDSEYMAGLRCIAAPIRFGDDIVGSIGISAPVSRFAKSVYPDYAKKVRSVADRIGTHLTPTEPNP